jgi:hypothetical protein
VALQDSSAGIIPSSSDDAIRNAVSLQPGCSGAADAHFAVQPTPFQSFLAVITVHRLIKRGRLKNSKVLRKKTGTAA